MNISVLLAGRIAMANALRCGATADGIVESVYIAMRVELQKSEKGGVVELARQAQLAHGSLVPIVHRKRHNSLSPNRNHLTQREKDVLFHVALDKSNRAIGQELGISQLTVKNHVQKILAIYQCRTRVGMVLRALVIGDLTLGDIKEAYERDQAAR